LFDTWRLGEDESGASSGRLFSKKMDRTVTISDLEKRLLSLTQNALPDVAEDTKQRVQRWYAKLPADWFDNPEPFEDGTPRHAGARTFMQPLKSSWQWELDANAFSVFFKHKRTGEGSTSNWGLRLQQYGSKALPGGVIHPVKKRALTIPVTADARGKRVRTFEKYYNRKLFLVGKEKAQGQGTLVWEDPAGELHAAYVLRRSSKVPSLRQRRGHDAIPNEKEIANWAKEAFINRIEYILTNGN